MILNLRIKTLKKFINKKIKLFYHQFQLLDQIFLKKQNLKDYYKHEKDNVRIRPRIN